MAFLSSSLPIPTHFLVLCLKFFSRSTKHIQLFPLSMVLFLLHSQDQHSSNSFSLRHRAKLPFISSHYDTKLFFWDPFHHFHAMLLKLHSSIVTAVPDITLPILTTVHWVHSASIPNSSGTVWLVSGITCISTLPLAAINSNDASDGSGPFPVVISQPLCYICEVLLDYVLHNMIFSCWQSTVSKFSTGIFHVWWMVMERRIWG